MARLGRRRDLLAEEVEVGEVRPRGVLRERRGGGNEEDGDGQQEAERGVEHTVCLPGERAT